MKYENLALQAEYNEMNVHVNSSWKDKRKDREKALESN